MSTNAQVQVKAREHFSVERCLGPGGAKALCEVLQKLSSGGYTADIRERLPWSAVLGQQHVYTRSIGSHNVLVNVDGTSPRIEISGPQRPGTPIEADILNVAHAAVNQVLALAVSEVIATRLAAYASERIPARVGDRVTQSVALKALEMQQSRLAIRASCAIRVNV